jgi:hypothetical protein
MAHNGSEDRRRDRRVVHRVMNRHRSLRRDGALISRCVEARTVRECSIFGRSARAVMLPAATAAGRHTRFTAPAHGKERSREGQTKDGQQQNGKNLPQGSIEPLKTVSRKSQIQRRHNGPAMTNVAGFSIGCRSACNRVPSDQPRRTNLQRKLGRQQKVTENTQRYVHTPNGRCSNALAVPLVIL